MSNEAQSEATLSPIEPSHFKGETKVEVHELPGNDGVIDHGVGDLALNGVVEAVPVGPLLPDPDNISFVDVNSAFTAYFQTLPETGRVTMTDASRAIFGNVYADPKFYGHLLRIVRKYNKGQRNFDGQTPQRLSLEKMINLAQVNTGSQRLSKP